MRFLDALKFLTIILLGHKARPERVGRSITYFPLVGIIVGLILISLNWLLRMVLPLTVVDALLIVAMIAITRASPLVGFMSTCDGIAGNKIAAAGRHDHQAGSFGIIGACSLFIVKYISLISIPELFLTPALVLMTMMSRWAMAYAICNYRYAVPEDAGKVLKNGATWWRLVIATLITLIAAYIAMKMAGLIVMVGIWMVVIIMATYFRHKFSGLTGDNYGAINEVAEVMVLILVCILTYNK